MRLKSLRHGHKGLYRGSYAVRDIDLHLYIREGNNSPSPRTTTSLEEIRNTQGNFNKWMVVRCLRGSGWQIWSWWHVGSSTARNPKYGPPCGVYDIVCMQTAPFYIDELEYNVSRWNYLVDVVPMDSLSNSNRRKNKQTNAINTTGMTPKWWWMWFCISFGATTPETKFQKAQWWKIAKLGHAICVATFTALARCHCQSPGATNRFALDSYDAKMKILNLGRERPVSLRMITKLMNSTWNVITKFARDLETFQASNSSYIE